MYQAGVNIDTGQKTSPPSLPSDPSHSRLFTFYLSLHKVFTSVSQQTKGKRFCLPYSGYCRYGNDVHIRIFFATWPNPGSVERAFNCFVRAFSIVCAKCKFCWVTECFQSDNMLWTLSITRILNKHETVKTFSRKEKKHDIYNTRWHEVSNSNISPSLK